MEHTFYSCNEKSNKCPIAKLPDSPKSTNGPLYLWDMESGLCNELYPAPVPSGLDYRTTAVRQPPAALLEIRLPMRGGPSDRNEIRYQEKQQLS